MTAEEMAMEMISFINSEILKQEKAMQQLQMKKIVMTNDQFIKEHSLIIGSVNTLHAIAQQVQNMNIKADDTKFTYTGKTKK